MNTSDADNPEGYPLSDEDKPEVLAKPATIERVAGTIITKTDAQGEDTPDADAEHQVDIEARALDGETRPLNLYTYSDNPEGVICSAQVDSDFTPKTQRTTNYMFFESDGIVRAETYSHVIDISKDNENAIDLMKGSPETQKRVLDEFTAAREAAMDDEDFVKKVGMNAPTEKEMLELERLILTGRVL